MPDKDNLFMTPHVNKMHKALEDDNIGPTSKWHNSFLSLSLFFLSFLAVYQAQAQTGTRPLFLGGKKAQLFIKAKREQVKVQDNQLRAGLSCLQRGRRKKGGREKEKMEEEEEKEEKWRWRVQEGWGGGEYTGRIRTKASLAPVETLMRVQIHYWLISHDTLWHRGWKEERECGRKWREERRWRGEGKGGGK